MLYEPNISTTTHITLQLLHDALPRQHRDLQASLLTLQPVGQAYRLCEPCPHAWCESHHSILAQTNPGQFGLAYLTPAALLDCDSLSGAFVNLSAVPGVSCIRHLIVSRIYKAIILA